MKIKNIFALAALSLPMAAAAQSIHFEDQDYKNLGVYDTWEESPFRTGELSGNYAVIDNHLTGVDEDLGVAPNASNKILAIQRSRFGSNTFGVRIDLNETFELTTSTQYVHAMVYRPYGGRVMVIGLGKRDDRPGQSPETEQFWAMTTGNIPANRWYEVVLPIKGNGGITISSLVVVPDCESPHAYTEDQVCYVDDIEVNGESSPKFSYESYPVNFDKESINKREDRYFSGIKLNSPSAGLQTASATGTHYFYHNMSENHTFLAKPGEMLTPEVIYKGTWMHSFVFLDKNQNGKFDVVYQEDGYVKHPESESVAYSYYLPDGQFTGMNSNGELMFDNNTLTIPAFQLAADMKPGFYRMRYKVDWNSMDAGGCADPSNHIANNGGGIIDVRLNVHNDQCKINSANRNGDVFKGDGSDLDGFMADFNQPLKIKVVPSHGFDYAGVVIKHGYNLNGDSIKHDVVQWEKVTIDRKEFNENGEYTIPAAYIDGDVEVEGLFVSGEYVEPAVPTRYKTTVVTDEAFADTTAWYTLQMGQDGYVVSYNSAFSYFAMMDTFVDPDNDAHLWCFTGNEEEGYQLYNKLAGPTMVLAATTDMGTNEGGYSFPYMYEKSNIPEGYVSVWRFEDSDALGSTGVEYAFMYEDGHRANKVNIRDGAWAFWSGGADGGSTIQVRFAKQNLPTGIKGVETEEGEKVYYDLSGRRVLVPAHGVYIENGHKVLVK